jgi:spermidine synthase
LGIGTTPSALITHGINTTIVEIDPIVREYAIKYFALPANHTPVIADAVKHLGDLARTKQKYDYVVHDVFTGGAEPVDLFTQEFLQDLRDVLKPNGAVAIVSYSIFGLEKTYY